MRFWVVSGSVLGFWWYDGVLVVQVLLLLGLQLMLVLVCCFGVIGVGVEVSGLKLLLDFGNVMILWIDLVLVRCCSMWFMLSVILLWGGVLNLNVLSRKLNCLLVCLLLMFMILNMCFWMFLWWMWIELLLSFELLYMMLYVQVRVDLGLVLNVFLNLGFGLVNVWCMVVQVLVFIVMLLEVIVLVVGLNIGVFMIQVKVNLLGFRQFR